ncbi:hypothetical protein P8605_35805 [Streptomyces sp. T-3]|nr:hypothetical protein [Streptomyces sp. T-3]
MPSLLGRIKQYARSPQGRRTIGRARRTSADPRRRAQARRLLGRFGRRR